MAIEDSDITIAALVPKTIVSDGQSVSEHSLAELIEAQKHLSQQTAASLKTRGLRFAKLSPPGATG